MAVLSIFPKFRAFDSNGDPLAGGKLYTYEAGTSTPLATYTDDGGGTPNANPVILDSSGEADVWLAGDAYKMALYNSSDVLQWTVDNIKTNTDQYGVLDEDDMASDSATDLATQQSIKAYVDTQLTAEDLDTAGDSGTGSIDLDSQSLTIAGTANEIETVAADQAVTIGIVDDPTLTGSVTINDTSNTPLLKLEGDTESTSFTYTQASGDLTIDSTTTLAVTFDCDDFIVKDGSDEYIHFDDTTPIITFGNATTNPSYLFAGSGAVEIDGPFNHDGSTFGVLAATPAAQQSHVADPAGGATVDAEARTAINSILTTLETFGFHATS